MRSFQGNNDNRKSDLGDDIDALIIRYMEKGYKSKDIIEELELALMVMRSK